MCSLLITVGIGASPVAQQSRIRLQHRRPGLDPWVRKIPGEGNDNSLQYSCLRIPMDRGAWWATVHGVAKSRTRLGDSSTTTITVCIKTDSVSLYWPVMITGVAALGLLS